MRKLALALLAACVLTLPASAGDSHTPGDDAPPCPPAVVCPDEGGTNAMTPSDGETVSIIVDGVLLLITLLP